MKYKHRFLVDAPPDEVVDFHRHSASMGTITPPPAVVRVHQAPSQLGEGDEMDFTIWLGPLPIHWTARIEAVNPTGFVDRQQQGPFDQWVHRHTFVSHNGTTTEVVDEIDFKLRNHLWWGLIGLGMAISLPLLFAYRGWKTRRLLEKSRRQIT